VWLVAVHSQTWRRRCKRNQSAWVCMRNTTVHCEFKVSSRRCRTASCVFKESSGRCWIVHCEFKVSSRRCWTVSCVFTVSLGGCSTQQELQYRHRSSCGNVNKVFSPLFSAVLLLQGVLHEIIYQRYCE
jgi:hypothetical protein